jgi:hypothetical protein
MTSNDTEKLFPLILSLLPAVLFGLASVDIFFTWLFMRTFLQNGLLVSQLLGLLPIVYRLDQISSLHHVSTSMCMHTTTSSLSLASSVESPAQSLIPVGLTMTSSELSCFDSQVFGDGFFCFLFESEVSVIIFPTIRDICANQNRNCIDAILLLFRTLWECSRKKSDENYCWLSPAISKLSLPAMKHHPLVVLFFFFFFFFLGFEPLISYLAIFSFARAAF